MVMLWYFNLCVCVYFSFDICSTHTHSEIVVQLFIFELTFLITRIRQLGV